MTGRLLPLVLQYPLAPLGQEEASVAWLVGYIPGGKLVGAPLDRPQREPPLILDDLDGGSQRTVHLMPVAVLRDAGQAVVDGRPGLPDVVPEVRQLPPGEEVVLQDLCLGPDNGVQLRALQLNGGGSTPPRFCP